MAPGSGERERVQNHGPSSRLEVIVTYVKSQVCIFGYGRL